MGDPAEVLVDLVLELAYAGRFGELRALLAVARPALVATAVEVLAHALVESAGRSAALQEAWVVGAAESAARIFELEEAQR
jgi:hypothetical protein